MNYKIVRDASGAVVAYGPNTENYAPSIDAGCTLSIEAVVPSPRWAPAKAAELAAIHQTFEQTINRLTGIAARLARAGDTPNALTCDGAVRALIALPNTASVLAAGDIAALKLAVKSEYGKAVALLSLVAKAEFRSMG